MAFQYLKGVYKKAEERLFIGDCRNMIEFIDFKLKECRFRLYIRKKLFTLRAVRQWDWLPRNIVDAPSMVIFMDRLDQALSNMI